MEKLIDTRNGYIYMFLDLLLQDKSTKKNIIWATDTYEALGKGFSDKDQLNKNRLTLRMEIIRPRIQKTRDMQQQRTRKKAEVFTPSWLCNKMNNYYDEEWFGRKNVFNIENKDDAWTAVKGMIDFSYKQKEYKIPAWQNYVDSRRLEITCGEAPYLVSRYDTLTGKMIMPLINRIGMLDRKLRVVNENTVTYEEWIKWALRAFEATYGYEYQGDNLLIARINLFLTFIDYYRERWNDEPDEKLLKKVINRIAWNIWQMDGLKDTVPLGGLHKNYFEVSLFGTDLRQELIYCKIYDWRRNRSITFHKLKEITMGKKLFDFVIGNPPYNEDFEKSGENGNYAKPVYNLFMDAIYEISSKVELIHPARFLFDAGSTPPAWNRKILNDEHFKVIDYEPNSAKVFIDTDVKGGIAISYHNINLKYKPIKVFIPFKELSSIKKKVESLSNKFLSNIISGRGIYKLSDKALEEHPEIVNIQSKGHKKDVGAGAFDKLNNIIFFENKPKKDEHEYVKFLGVISNKRVYRWGRKDYQDFPDSFYYYKVFIPKANGSGALGEVLSTPLVGEPLVGATETFLSIGAFETLEEANNCLKYVKSKFARVMLGILKVTQDNTKNKWRYVPLQDFTTASDIDWSKNIDQIDVQLYRKYNLDEEEIKFIESHVKEMA